MDLKESAAGNGADAETCPWGDRSQARALSSGNEDDADLTGGERLPPSGAGFIGREPVMCGIQPKRRRRRGPQRQLAEVALVLPLRMQPLDQAKVDAFDLPGKRLPACGANCVPEAQQVLLAERLENRQKTVTVHGYQPMTMFDSMAFRACSRSVPV